MKQDEEDIFDYLVNYIEHDLDLFGYVSNGIIYDGQKDVPNKECSYEFDERGRITITQSNSGIGINFSKWNMELYVSYGYDAKADFVSNRKIVTNMFDKGFKSFFEVYSTYEKELKILD